MQPSLPPPALLRCLQGGGAACAQRRHEIADNAARAEPSKPVRRRELQEVCSAVASCMRHGRSAAGGRGLGGPGRIHAGSATSISLHPLAGCSRWMLRCSTRWRPVNPVRGRGSPIGRAARSGVRASLRSGVKADRDRVPEIVDRPRVRGHTLAIFMDLRMGNLPLAGRSSAWWVVLSTGTGQAVPVAGP